MVFYQRHHTHEHQNNMTGYRVKIPIPSTEINKGLLARYISYINPTL
jgi:hypothetical protein